jgi:hypothetical protein
MLSARGNKQTPKQIKIMDIRAQMEYKKTYMNFRKVLRCRKSSGS